jgi:hypothetical protein
MFSFVNPMKIGGLGKKTSDPRRATAADNSAKGLIDLIQTSPALRTMFCSLTVLLYSIHQRVPSLNGRGVFMCLFWGRRRSRCRSEREILIGDLHRDLIGPVRALISRRGKVSRVLTVERDQVFHLGIASAPLCIRSAN